MARLIQFEGRQISLPDDATDAEVTQALGGGAPAAAPQPAVSTQGFDEAGMAAPPTPSGVTVPFLVQGAGKGVADAVSLPLAGNESTRVSGQMAAWLAENLGGKSPEEAAKLAEPADASGLLSNAVASLAEKIGLRTRTPETFADRAQYEASRFGVQGAALAAGLTRAAAKRATEMALPGALPKPLDPILRPYVAEPVKAVVNDTVAGAGAGTAVAATQGLPNEVRDAGGGLVGVLADLAAAGAGAIGGHTASSTIMRTPTKLSEAVSSSRVVNDIPLDPMTSAATTNKQADLAGRFLQSETIAPKETASALLERAQQFKDDGRPMPTTGLMSDDRGLQMVERGQRVKNSTGTIMNDANTPAEVKNNYSFGARDTALRDAAAADVQSVRPTDTPTGVTLPGATEELKIPASEALLDRASGAQDGAGYRANVNTDVNQRRADAAVNEDQFRLNRTQEIRADQGAPVEAARGQGPAASERLHAASVEGSLVPMRAQRNANYENIPAVEVSAQPLVTAANNIENSTRGLPANTRAGEVPAGPLADFNSFIIRDAEGNITGVQNTTADVLTRMRSAISAEESAVRRNPTAPQNPALLDNYRTLKQAIAQAVESVSESAGAVAHDRTVFQPVWGKTESPTAYKLRQDVDANRAAPSQTAGRFIQPERPEKAAELQRIIGSSATPEAARAAAREYMVADLAGRNVVDAQTGVIRPQVLRQWAAKNAANIDLVPGFRQEIDTMLARAQQGERLAGSFAQELTTSRRAQNITPERVDRNALTDIAGLDEAHIAKQLFGSQNPHAEVRALVDTIGKDDAALRGLKAVIADHFTGKVMDVNPVNVTEGTQSVNFSRLVKEFNKNERALAEVFSPEEMNTLRRAQKTLEPLTKRAGQATIGSPTAENTGDAITRALEAPARLYYGALEGGAMVKKVKILTQTVFRDDTPQAAQRLIARAMFDPKLAADLLSREIKPAVGPAGGGSAQKILRRGQVLRENARDTEPKKPTRIDIEVPLR